MISKFDSIGNRDTFGKRVLKKGGGVWNVPSVMKKERYVIAFSNCVSTTPCCCCCTHTLILVSFFRVMVGNMVVNIVGMDMPVVVDRATCFGLRIVDEVEHGSI